MVVDRDGVVIVGHTRPKAAQRLNMDRVPVHVADLTPEQARAYRIADNQTAAIAEWDEDVLVDELESLRALDVDLADLGFSDAELGEWLAPHPTNGLTDPDEVPGPPADPITQRGDLWLLGEHRLLCDDSTNAQRGRFLRGSARASRGLKGGGRGARARPAPLPPARAGSTSTRPR